MALSASTIWEVRGTGLSTAGGGFNVGNSGFAADLTATGAMGSGPVVSSGSYTFASGDVGALLFIKSGNNWIPGWYAIASVSGGAATLTASPGSVQLYGLPAILNTVAGCAIAASPAGGTWSVDYSQQPAAQYSYTDLAIGATATNLTSAAHPFGKNCVGNLIRVTGGTGFTTGWYEVVSVSSTTATMDRAVGTASSTGGTGGLGGCLDGPNTLSQAMAASNKAFLQAGAGYTVSATPTFNLTVTASDTMPMTGLIGYGAYRGDNGQATITLSATSGLYGLYLSGSGWWIANVAVNCASLANSCGIGLAASGSTIVNCKAQNFKSYGIVSGTGTYNIYAYNEVTGGLSGATAALGVQSTTNLVVGNYIHDNACPGVACSQYGQCVCDNLVANNTGANSDGIAIAGDFLCERNTVHGSGRHGISNTSTGIVYQVIRNNLLSSNGGYGLVGAAGAGMRASILLDGNAYYNNTSGARNYADDRGAVNAQNGVAPYIDSLDVILTVTPFVAPSDNDYRLNNVAGGGASCRGHGSPTSWNGNPLTTSAADIGASQHADLTNLYRGRRGT